MILNVPGTFTSYLCDVVKYLPNYTLPKSTVEILRIKLEFHVRERKCSEHLPEI